jgi:ABC-2 type transport system ATP-binding protein
VCSRALIIARGRILADGTPAELERRSSFHNAVTLATSAPDAAAALSGLAGVARVETVEPGVYRAYPANGAAIVAEVSDLARAQGWPVDRLSVDPGRLDEVFRTLTRGGPGGSGAEAA